MVALNIERREMKMIEEYIDAICAKRNVYQLARESGFKTDLAMVAFENGYREGLIMSIIGQMKKEGLSIKKISDTTGMTRKEIIVILKKEKERNKKTKYKSKKSPDRR